jgi:cytochrome c-type biogenesis protein CcmH/NrfG
MSGLLACIGLGVLAAVLLWLCGARGAILAVALAALIGGALLFDRLRQVPVAPAPAETRQKVQSLASIRHAFTGRFTRGENWLAMADSMAARGNTADAAGILIAAVKQHPRDYALWTGLGTMLTAHTGGLNPGAELAFERAIDLAPTYPAPRYFYGIAKMQSGDRKGALAEWRAVLQSAPADASWRGLVEDQITATETSRAPD